LKNVVILFVPILKHVPVVQLIAELVQFPETVMKGTDAITEIVTFQSNDVPDEFGWWSKEDLIEFLEAHME